jgi:hypothetical protein
MSIEISLVGGYCEAVVGVAVSKMSDNLQARSGNPGGYFR